jgi:hypothetical protein
MPKKHPESLKPAVDKLLEFAKARNVTSRKELWTLLGQAAPYVRNAKTHGSADRKYQKEKDLLRAACTQVNSYAYKRIFDCRLLKIRLIWFPFNLIYLQISSLRVDFIPFLDTRVCECRP